MRSRPNLNMLRTFVEAARLQSFQAASDQLGLTQSAVSKQIATLEAQIGQPLFLRHHRRVELTPYGVEVAQAAAPAFEHLDKAFDGIGDVQTRQIRFSGDADFVQLWLFPRLTEFEDAHPNIRLSISTQIGMNTAPDDGYDCGVIWGRGNWQNCQFSPLLGNRIFPVAKPGFFDHLGRPPRLDDITDGQLIHDQSRFWWAALRNASGLPGFDANFGRTYNQSVLCLQAAIAGKGVTIGDEVTARGHLEDGTLERLFDASLPSHDTYFVVRPRNTPLTEPVETFLSWLESKASEHRDWAMAARTSRASAP